MNIVSFGPVSGEDGTWAYQYLTEHVRLDLPFILHFDRCTSTLRRGLGKHRLCVGSSLQYKDEVEFTEMHKQPCIDMAKKLGFDWAIQTDVDETWEKDAKEKLQVLLSGETADYVQVTWVNVWGDREHIRVDGLFNKPPRVKIYNLQGNRRWIYDHMITNGCKLIDAKGSIIPSEQVKGNRIDLTCLHHGLMTRELREFHKARWDRIYSAAVGSNPYGFWNYCLDEETYPPAVIPNPYL